MSLTKPNAIFWDWDGTLSDSYSFLEDAHNHTLTTLGLPAFQENEYRKYFGKPREMLYPAIYKEHAEEALGVFGAYVTQNNHKIPLINGAKEALEKLTSMGITMGIVSNKKSEYIKLEVQHQGVENHFQIIVGSGEAREDKPSSAPLQLAIERLNLTHDMQDIWFVGDTENDLLCAQNAGCKALFIEGHPEGSALISQYKPDFTYKNYKEFMEFLVAI